MNKKKIGLSLQFKYRLGPKPKRYFNGGNREKIPPCLRLEYRLRKI